MSSPIDQPLPIAQSDLPHLSSVPYRAQLLHNHHVAAFTPERTPPIPSPSNDIKSPLHHPPLCRAISPPTPAPSPQPDNDKASVWPHALQHANSNPFQPPQDPLLLLDAFAVLSLSNRAKFLHALLPMLNLNELTNLSGRILPRLKRDFLRELPIEVSLHILSFVDDPKTLMRAGMVSRFWRSLVSDETTWKGMCSKRGFNNGSQPIITLTLSERMEKERQGRVAIYRAGVEERRRRKKAQKQDLPPSRSSALRSPIPAPGSDSPFRLPEQDPPPQSSSLGLSRHPIGTGLGLGGTTFGHNQITTIQPNNSTDFALSIVEPLDEQISTPYLVSAYPSGLPISRRNSFSDVITSPRLESLGSSIGLVSSGSTLNPAHTTNTAGPTATATGSGHGSPVNSTPFALQRPINSAIKQPHKVINANSPEPGMVAPTNATSPRRTRPHSMPMLGLSLNMTRSVSAFADIDYSSPSIVMNREAAEDQLSGSSQTGSYGPERPESILQTPSSIGALDLPQTASSFDDMEYSPRTPFSYKSYFKRAYLTESNWLRGPGELMAMQTSQNNDGNEWVVTSLGFDDDWIVVGMATSKIHVFSAHTGEFVRTLTGHELGVWCLALVSKGGMRDPRDALPTDPKGKAPEFHLDDDVEPAGGATIFAPSAATAEWVSSGYGYGGHTHGASMMRAKGGLGMSVWARDRQSSQQTAVQGHVPPPPSDVGSIFQPASANTTLDEYYPAQWTTPHLRAQGSTPGAPASVPRSSIVSSSDSSNLSAEPGRPAVPGSASHTVGRSGSRLSTPAPHERRRPRRPSSFSSFMTSSQTHSHPDDHAARSGAQFGTGGVPGGMGLGAGGPSAGNLQQASACGVARGWGQKGSLVVSGGCDRDVRVWEVSTGRCKYVLHGHSSTIRCLKVLDGRPIAVSGSRDSSLRVWDIERGTQKHVLVGHTSSVRAIEVHGNRVVSGSYDTTCRLWDVDTGECLKVLRGHYHQIYAVAFDGQRIASGSMDSTVCIWSAATGELVALLQGHTALVGQVQINGQANVLVTGGSDGRVVIFSLESYECLHRLCAHDNSVTCLQFDDRFVVTGGNDGRVKLWDFKTGAFIRELAEPCEAVWRITLRDDKAVLLCKREGKTVMEVISFRPSLD